MPQLRQTAARGLNLRSGKKAPGGFVLRARNSRFLVGDDSDRLWALLGRTFFNDVQIAANPAPDSGTLKTIFPYLVDSGTSKLIAHKGGSIYEADLDDASEFSGVYNITATGTTPRGIPAPYKTLLYYPIGANEWDATNNFLTRTSSSWRQGGHRTPTATFTAAGTGSGSYGSTTDVNYLVRIYDDSTDTESAHGPVTTLTAPGATFTAIRLTFSAGLSLIDAELGTHVRIYRTLLSEAPGLYWRADPQMSGYVSGKGIPIADFVAGFTIDDSATNTQVQINGLVRADGEEGTTAWAEHGGPPPNARGGIIFQEHLVLYGIPGRETELIASARGYPESFPVDFDGVYQYNLPLSTDKNDAVQRCLLAGPYLVAITKQSVFRISRIPTYAEPGFDRIIQDVVTDEHGMVGPYAGDSFGVGEQESQWAMFVSGSHGPMITNGVRTEPVVQRSDWFGLLEQAYAGNVVVQNYPRFQECWIFYTPKGGTTNTAALIVNYSKFDRFGLRLSGPIDVQSNMACYAEGNDGVSRMWLASSSVPHVFVQDNGSIDEQRNNRADGGILLDWETRRAFPRGLSHRARVARTFVYGGSGTAKTFDVEHKGLTARREFTRVNQVTLGPTADGEPREGADSYFTNVNAQGHRTRLTYTGATGSDYGDEDSDNLPPFLESVEYEEYSGGRTGRAK